MYRYIQFVKFTDYSKTEDVLLFINQVISLTDLSASKLIALYAAEINKTNQFSSVIILKSVLKEDSDILYGIEKCVES